MPDKEKEACVCLRSYANTVSAVKSHLKVKLNKIVWMLMLLQK